MKKILFMVLLGTLLLGCCSVARNNAIKPTQTQPSSHPESAAQVKSVVTSVVGAISGQEMSEKDLRELTRQVQRDPEAQSALKVLTNSVSGEGAVIKYCPVDGKRYSAKFQVCPEHGVLLKEVKE